jgi:hypothetical protein
MSDLTFSRIDLTSLLNILSVTQVLSSVPDPTLALFFTFFAPCHVAPIGSASCSKTIFYFTILVAPPAFLPYFNFSVSHLPLYSTSPMIDRTFFILDLTFLVLHFNLLVPYLT